MEQHMSSEPKAVGYVSAHSLDDLAKSDTGFLIVGIHRTEPKTKTIPLYDEQSLSALLAEVEALRQLVADLSQTLAWREFGECRGYSEKLLDTSEVLALAKMKLENPA
jgi:hypothetical protein